MAALWLLHGTKRLASRTLSPNEGMGAKGLLRLLQSMPAPMILQYIVHAGLSRCRDSLAIPYVVVAAAASVEDSLRVDAHETPPVAMIGDYPAFAFDMHTRAGKKAIAQFDKECRAWLQSAGVLSTGNLIFTIEGGALDRRISSPSFDRIRDCAWQLEVFGQHPVSGNEWSAGLKVPLQKLDQKRRQAAVSDF